MTTTHTIPAGAEQIPGAVAAYEAYHKARDARDAEPRGKRTRKTLDAFAKASENLAALRTEWRQVAQYVRDAGASVVAEAEAVAHDAATGGGEPR